MRGTDAMLLRQIEYLHAVVDEGNFYAAAEKCHVSQSAVSQQIKKLEDELGVKLLERHNRTFSLTEAGAHFYQKSLVIRADIECMIRETKKIGTKDGFVLRLGYYKGYRGAELSEAVAAFSEKYPTIPITVMSGSHEEIYDALRHEEIDIALNDQRRAFSDEYHNLVLSESVTYIEISSRNRMAVLERVEANDLKNTSCILVAAASQREEEMDYYRKIVGLQGEFIFADSVQDARLKIITGQGYLPVDVIGEETWFDTAVSRIPLTRNCEPIHKTYCAFWKQDNSGYYVEEFAEILRGLF